MKAFRKLIYPYLVWMIIFILVPMLFVVLYAFTVPGNEVISIQFTLDNFIKFIDPVFIKVLWESFRIAFLTTIICLILGYPIAFFISRKSDQIQTLLILLVTVPMWINMLVRTYSWISIIQKNGLLNHFLGWFGIGPIDIMYTDFSVMLGMVYNFLPFMIIQIYNSLAKMDQSLIHASYDLGANPYQTFKRIIFPLSVPGVISGITLVFLPSMSTFVIPKFLGGGSYVLIGNLIETQFIELGDFNFGSAISLIMALLIMIMMHFANKIDKGDNGDVNTGGPLI